MPQRSPPTVGDALAPLRALAPERLAEAWDKVGLALGDEAWPAPRAMLCIDLTQAVLREAIAARVGLLVCYHPPLFHPLDRLVAGEPRGALLLEAARRTIALYSPHTALDAAVAGLNDWLADALGAGRCSPIVPSPEPDAQLRKVVSFVPTPQAQAVRRAMSDAGAGHIGNYQECSYNLPGFGTFRPLDGARPAIGVVGELETVDEVRIEMVCPAAAVPDVVRAMRSAHPYEEPAFDILPLLPDPSPPDRGQPRPGQGRFVELRRPASLGALVRRIKRWLALPRVELALPEAWGPLAQATRRPVRRIALCAGAGHSVLVKASDAELLITGEMRHHDVLALRARGQAVLLAGHTQTERPFLPELAERLAAGSGGRVAWSVASSDRAPSVPA